ncbi:MAG: ABC transporter substrate-binding protein [Gammaproteobacteria bacterium]
MRDRRCGLGLAIATLAAFCLPFAAPAVDLVIACSAVGTERALCAGAASAWARDRGHRVSVVSTPDSATERLAVYQQILAAASPEVDVLQIDLVWPGLLARHLIDLAPYAGQAPDAYLPALVRSNTVDGRLVALPWFVDVGLLYYRSDLLRRHRQPVPSTWQELTDTAARIQQAERAAGRSRFWGFVWQGRAYEGLTCNALEWIASHGAGELVAQDGSLSVDVRRAAAVLRRAAGWIGSISPPGTLNYAEEESRAIFQSGDALFMRNWPYAYALMNAAGSPVAGRVGIAALPAGAPGGRRAGTLGGQQLAVSRYSRHPREAAELVLYLTGAAEQMRRARAGGFNPTREVLYADAGLAASSPVYPVLRSALREAIARPAASTGARYNQVSALFWTRVHAALSGDEPAGQALERLHWRLEGLRRGGKW